MATQGKLNAAEAARAVAAPIVSRSVNGAVSKSLPSGVLKALAADEAEYCDQFISDFKNDCEQTFRANLLWRELPLAPLGRTAILVENRNMGFCGSAGCALRLFIEQPDAQFAQTLGKDGEVGTLERIEVLKTIANGHYNLQKTWADGMTHTIYRWNGERYSAH